MLFLSVSPNRPAPIIHRADKQGDIQSALLRAEDVVTRVVVHGPIGSGKSVLLDAVATNAEISGTFSAGIYWRSEMLQRGRAGKRRLLLLDMPTIEEVRLAESRLGPGDGVIYASRGRNVADWLPVDSVLVDASKVTVDQAAKLLGLDPSATQIHAGDALELIDLAGRLAYPLALCGRAMVGQWFNPDVRLAWSKELRSARHLPEALVRASLNLRLGCLGAAERAHFARLAQLAERQRQPEVLSSLWDVNELEAVRFLSELESKALVRLRADGRIALAGLG